MQVNRISALVLLLLGAAALLALVAPVVKAADVEVVDAAGEELEDSILDEADAELDEEEGITADDEGAALVEVDDAPAVAAGSDIDSNVVPQTPGVIVQPPASPPAAPPKKGKKGGKKKLPIVAAYYGEKLPRKPKQYALPEYGDPNPKKTAAAAKKALKRGKPAHKKIFTSNYYSPLPAPHPHVKCFGKGKKEKCYRVVKGKVVGRHNHKGLGRVVSHTSSLHNMEKKGFVDAAYDDNLAKWKPRKHKRTLSPAAVMSFAEVDAEDEEEDEAEAEDEESEEEADEEAVDEEMELDESAEDEEDEAEQDEVEAEEQEEEDEEADQDVDENAEDDAEEDA